jgi:prepilin-type N-terminal cleavage/methylation domain-containing protein
MKVITKFMKKDKVSTLFQQYKAFTLAEVLITLGIIGIVAAMTIPTLMNNIQDQQYKVAWKKAFSNINQVTQLLIMDNGGSLDGVFTSNQNLMDNYGKYMKFVKTCGGNFVTDGCWPSYAKYLGGTPRGDINGVGTGAVLSDGTLAYFEFKSTDCTSPLGTLLTCGYITFDINGFKNPNTIGKDEFQVYILKNTIKPAGITGSGDEDCSSYGWGCSMQYLSQ